MYKSLLAIVAALLLISCQDEFKNPDNLKLLSLEEIKKEYIKADSLNNLEDRSNIDTTSIILGIDERNGKVLIRTCQSRGFGCLLFNNYYTILYQNCDSVCCESSKPGNPIRSMTDNWRL